MPRRHAPAPTCERVQIRKPFHQIGQNLAISDTSNVDFPKPDQNVTSFSGATSYRDRNRVERMFGKLKQQRRIATRYDKTVLSFEIFLNLAATRFWLKSFVNAALGLLSSNQNTKTNRHIPVFKCLRVYLHNHVNQGIVTFTIWIKVSDYSRKNLICNAQAHGDSFGIEIL